MKDEVLLAPLAGLSTTGSLLPCLILITAQSRQSTLLIHPILTQHIVVPWDLSIPISMSADQISTELMTPQKQTSANTAFTEPLITNHPLTQNLMSPQELQGIDTSRFSNRSLLGPPPPGRT